LLWSILINNCHFQKYKKSIKKSIKGKFYKKIFKFYFQK